MALSIVLATTNPAKAEHLRLLCEGLDVVLVDGPGLGGMPEVDEEGTSHLGNAVHKAVAWSRLNTHLALASDGGLAIPALGDDWSSLVTRRGTGGDVSDEEHAARLLRRMRDLRGDQRAAHRVEAVAIARDGTLLGAWEASFWIGGLWVSDVSGKRDWELTDADLVAEDEPWLALTPRVRDLLGRLGG